MQTVHCSLTLLELVIYNDSLLLVPHLERGDKSSDKLPTMVSKWRALYPRVPWSLLSWHCIIADLARLSINDRSWSRLQHCNSIGAHSALMILQEKKEKSYCLQKVFQEQMHISNLILIPC